MKDKGKDKAAVSPREKKHHWFHSLKKTLKSTTSKEHKRKSHGEESGDGTKEEDTGKWNSGTEGSDQGPEEPEGEYTLGHDDSLEQVEQGLKYLQNMLDTRRENHSAMPPFVTGNDYHNYYARAQSHSGGTDEADERKHRFQEVENLQLIRNEYNIRALPLLQAKRKVNITIVITQLFAKQ